MSIEILRSGQINDIFQLEKIGKVSLPIYYGAFHIINTLKDDKSIILKYITDNKVSGFCIIDINEDKRYHITSIAVDKNHRKKHIGTKLIEYIKNNYDVNIISLYVQSCNDVAINFYKKNGFKIIEKEEDYYTTLPHKEAYYCELLV